MSTFYVYILIQILNKHGHIDNDLIKYTCMIIEHRQLQVRKKILVKFCYIYTQYIYIFFFLLDQLKRYTM